jgi:DNA polymerase-3 subunit delta'
VHNDDALSWLTPTWQALSNLHQSKKVPHAILLVGPQGIGKTQLRQAFEQLLLCQQPSDQACGHCRGCFLYQQQSHPDFHVFGQEDTTVGIDDVRNVTQFLSQTAHQNGRKVISLLNIESLHVNAANALLKTLEEPPADSVLILVTKNTRTLLTTIRSRCFILPVSLPSTESALHWLKIQFPQENAKQLQRCLTLAGGSPLKAQELLHATPDFSLNLTFIKSFFQPNQPILMANEQVQQFITNEPQEALYLLYYWLTEFICRQMQCTADFVYGDEECVALMKSVTLEQLFAFLDKVTQSLKALSLPGINKALQFEALFNQWQRLSSRGE